MPSSKSIHKFENDTLQYFGWVIFTIHVPEFSPYFKKETTYFIKGTEIFFLKFKVYLFKA